MTYAELRDKACTGDVFAVKGQGLAGGIIRALTGESYSHVAMLVWFERGLLVFEFVEGIGYQSMPASEWLRRRQGQQISYCVGPRLLRSVPSKVASAALHYRNSSVVSRWYGWLSLIKVFLSQLSNYRIPVRQKVCSTFIQECWQAGGFRLNRTADPGDIVAACGDGVFRVDNDSPTSGLK